MKKTNGLTVIILATLILGCNAKSESTKPTVPLTPIDSLMLSGTIQINMDTLDRVFKEDNPLFNSAYLNKQVIIKGFIDERNLFDIWQEHTIDQSGDSLIKIFGVETDLSPETLKDSGIYRSCPYPVFYDKETKSILNTFKMNMVVTDLENVYILPDLLPGHALNILHSDYPETYRKLMAGKISVVCPKDYTPYEKWVIDTLTITGKIVTAGKNGFDYLNITLQNAKIIKVNRGMSPDSLPPYIPHVKEEKNEPTSQAIDSTQE